MTAFSHNQSGIICFHQQASDQLRRYDSLTNQCKAISPQLDLNSLVKILQPDSPPKVPKKSYAPPAGDIDEVSRMRKSREQKKKGKFY